jgi:septin 7
MRKLTNTLSPSPKGFQSPKFSDSDFREVRSLGLELGRPKSSDKYYYFILGFGDAVDNSNCWDPVISFVESQYESFLDAETRVNRVQLPDARVHACLYFIAPSGHGLKPLDVEFMKRLHDKVNVIPVIAKSDTMTPEEITHFKQKIMNQIVQAKIRIYEFPEEEMANGGGGGGSSAAEEADRRENRKMKDRVPFAVVGSNCLIESTESGGKKVRGRKYPWGIVDVSILNIAQALSTSEVLSAKVGVLRDSHNLTLTFIFE